MTYYQELQTPCFIFDEAEFKRGICGFRDALKKFFQRVDIGYSVKTNSLPYALRTARDNSCMAEVVSYDEYELALLCGFSYDRIIHNGPIKSQTSTIQAIIGGVLSISKPKKSWNGLGSCLGIGISGLASD